MGNLEQLKKLFLEIRNIKSIEALLMWDQEVYMPEGAGAARANHIAFLSSLSHSKHTSPEFRSCLERLVDMDTGSPLDKNADKDTERMLYLTWKEYRDAVALPPEFVEELSRHQSTTQQVWARSRQENDYKTFAPYLEKMIQLKKQEAGYYGNEPTPYDSLAEKFEPGISVERISALFDQLRGPLVQLVKDIKEKGTSIDDRPLSRVFDLDKQWEFGLETAGAMGFDFSTGRLDKSTHPFTISFHPSDVRITTRLDKRQFKTSIFAVLHEAGHGLYEQGLPADDYNNSLGDSISYGFHESQSRLWENLVGRSKAFWKYFYPKLETYFKRPLKGITLDDFYKMINTVTPSLIRVEADEVTYCLHIMLRFEIEKMMINGDLSVDDLPDLWNQKMQEYLGIRPKDFKDGVMQDIHWSMGAIGYFPTYALGNLYAAPIMNQAYKDIDNLETKIENGNLLPLKDWLTENIHKKGRRQTAEQLIKDLTGQELSAKPFLDYLEKKYRDIYNI